jgi:hypothetical protein
MKLLFGQAAENLPADHPFKLSVSFQKLTSNWLIRGCNYPTIEEGLEAARKAAALSGVIDFYYYSAPARECAQLVFLFKTNLDKLIFQGIVSEDTEGAFEQIIYNASTSQSKTQERNIRHFIEEQELDDVSILRSDLNVFTVQTMRHHDYLLIATNHEKGNFNKGTGPQDNPLLHYMLTYSPAHTFELA